jgi:AraC family transcriptional regulator
MKVAKFIHRGKLEGLKDTYGKIMNDWLPTAGLELEWSKPTLEMYDERFKEDSDDSECEIWVPVK